MLTSKDKLLRFLQLKQDIIKKRFKINYMLKADFDEVKSWDELDCEITVSNIAEDHETDEETCAWCIIEEMKCSNCGYGKRNKICTEDDSARYDRIQRKMKSSIVDSIPIRTLLKKSRIIN